MKNLKKIDFNGKIIQFELKYGTVMVNATEMAKIFDKRISDFLRLNSTKKYIKLLLKSENIHSHLSGYNENNVAEVRHYNKDIVAEVPRYNENDIVFTNKKAGTFMHRMLALKFAAWLSPEFEVWVYRTIEELLFGQYKEMDLNIQKDARIKNKIKELEEKLSGNEDFNELNELKRLQKQVVRERGKAIKNQLSLFNF